MVRLNGLGAKAFSELLHQLYSVYRCSLAEHLCRAFSDHLDYDLFYYDGSGFTFSRAHPASGRHLVPAAVLVALPGFSGEGSGGALVGTGPWVPPAPPRPTDLSTPYQAVISGRRSRAEAPIVTLVRYGRDFSSRERAWLRLLEPHLAQLHVDGQALTQARRAPEVTTGFPGDVHPSVRARGAGSGETFLPLRGLGLTAREAQVLLWVSRGKTNAEIAIILDISGRTVGKHMEHIAGKLGVETRTSAAVIALERLAAPEGLRWGGPLRAMTKAK